jgi:hypothetical protein
VVDRHIDLHFVLRQPDCHLQLAPTSNLQFLSLIELNKVPLYLSAGPSLEVWTGDRDTATWIEEALLSSLKSRSAGSSTWWDEGVGTVLQSQVGLLLQVHDEEQSRQGPVNPRVTEVVVYGVVSKPQTIPEPLSPPPSSSPWRSTNSELTNVDLKVFALPISSDLLYTPLNTNIQALAPLSPPSVDSEPCAQFLPTQHSPTKKRKRAGALLDDAIKRQKNIQRKGGDGVGLLVTGGSSYKPHASVKKEPSDPGSSLLSPIDTSIPQASKNGLISDLKISPVIETTSRLSSITSNLANDRVISLSRPPSRKRSSLHRVSSSISLGPASPVFIETSDPTSEQNKALLSRIILAGMRLYGLSRSKERPTSASASGTEIQTDFGCEDLESKEVDDFKGVYHATYRAATFALRRKLKGEMVLEKDIVRSVVDQLLVLFCEDRGE